MTNKQFYKKLVKATREAVTRIREAKAAYNAALTEQADPKYSAEYKRNVLASKTLDAKFLLDEEKSDAMRELYGIVGDYAQELRDADTLKGADINDDARLFNCGIMLGKNDLISMLRRNSGNATMQQLIFKYADQNKIDLGGLIYIGNRNAIEMVEKLKGPIDTTLRWIDDFSEETCDANIERVWGDGSEIYKAFMDGDPHEMPDVVAADVDTMLQFEGGAAAAIAEANDKIAGGQ